MTQPTVNRLCIIGVGLIGGSLAKALREKNHCREIIAYDVDHTALQYAKFHHIVDVVTHDVASAVKDADVVVIAIPMLGMRDVFASIKPNLKKHAILTDVGSVKNTVVSDAQHVFANSNLRFVPGHPIAGSEKSSIEAARADLFSQHKIILTPCQFSDADAVSVIKNMWAATGADVLMLSPEEHDHILAATSHLPHLLAFLLVDTLAKQGENEDIFRYAAGGFRDFTRIAASDPTMWHDIFMANKSATLSILDVFSNNLSSLRKALDENDSKQLLGVFTRAQTARNHFSKMLARRSYIEEDNKKTMKYIMQPGGKITGDIRVPGDKSISHRSIMLGSLANGVTEVTGFLEGEDSLATLQSFRDMGVVIEGPDHGHVRIFGVGLNGLQKPPGPLYLGNSGTSMRLLSGLLSAQAFDITLTGDESLSKRPMKRVSVPLQQMGAKISAEENGTPPIHIQGGALLKGITYAMPMASAQVKSSLLLAGLYAQGETTITEPAPTRDHTERMLKGFGYKVNVNGSTVSLSGGGQLTATNIDVPADISSSAFFMVAASIAEESDITLKHVGINPTRIGVINILRLMGANITLQNEKEVGGEPVADIRVKSAQLKGIDIPIDQVPLAIDEFPAIFVAAACAAGKTILRGAEELRVKESDRIQVMADGLQTLGIKAEPTPDGIVIEGGQLGSGRVDSHGDHRIAMSFAVAALRAKGVIEILDCSNVATSFPNFVELASEAGMHLSVVE
jgi:3-phosphoshikimate 1-carboxyvinyltransferase